MIKNYDGLKNYLVQKAKGFGEGCETAYISLSGGIDSSLVVVLLTLAFDPRNVIAMYRSICSNPKHLEHARMLQKKFGFRLVEIDGNEMYNNLVSQVKSEFARLDLPWADEGTEEANKIGLTAAYDSCKSRFTTAIAGLISKAGDRGRGRIFGTGNGEEDGLLRYYDKFGDGAVDNCLLGGLNKAEVRQLARHLGVPEEIICKIPSADLRACGDRHNDEDQLTRMAGEKGFKNLKISYGAADGSSEGNIAWVWKEDLKNGVVTGALEYYAPKDLEKMGYNEVQIQTIQFVRAVEESTRHKVSHLPSISRRELLDLEFVD